MPQHSSVARSIVSEEEWLAARKALLAKEKEASRLGDGIADSPGSYGWSGGFGTTFVADPAEDMVAILLLQRLMRGADDTAINQGFLTLAYGAIDD